MFRIEFFEKGIYEFKNITEAKKWAKSYSKGEIRKIFNQKYFTIKRLIKDKKGFINTSFTEEIER